ncbi:hypothetical protein NPIL_291771 [Nephila pilipes]|uniref:Uncharacterized protein n=1 Tax=Nephila pilipes TaxID=299642 RepID=A0A8X6UKY3_NEPPI|nr:hypothetical protein NPIL_291771 [Nephila pilipes]
MKYVRKCKKFENRGNDSHGRRSEEDCQQSQKALAFLFKLRDLLQFERRFKEKIRHRVKGSIDFPSLGRKLSMLSSRNGSNSNAINVLKLEKNLMFF